MITRTAKKFEKGFICPLQEINKKSTKRAITFSTSYSEVQIIGLRLGGLLH